MAKTKLSRERIKSDATVATRQDGNIRERVRDLILRALRNRPFDRAEVLAVLHAMTKGITVGAAKHTGDVRAALSQAFSGLDETLLPDTLSEFSTKMGSIVTDSTRAGIHTTRDVGVRFAELASGILAGIADPARSESSRSTPRAARQSPATRRRSLHK